MNKVEDLFLEKDRDVLMFGSRLPHWEQEGKLQFITFRLADSMPQAILRQYKAEKAKWLDRHPQPLSPEDENEYIKLFQTRLDKYCDAGYGECLLQRRGVADIVVEKLEAWNNVDYKLYCYVVMPNHLHVLCQMPQQSLSKVVGRWKGGIAREVNRLLGRTGDLWQKGYFDRIVRSDDHLRHVFSYIIENIRHGGVAWGGIAEYKYK